MVEEPARIIGYDASGIVEAVGASVTLFKPGDEVYYAGDITRSGTNAEFHGKVRFDGLWPALTVFRS